MDNEYCHLRIAAFSGIICFNDKSIRLGNPVYLSIRPEKIHISRDKPEESPQTIYPDFTLFKNEDDANKIAIDVKTTYRKGKDRPFVYTLGSYTSFLRNNTKNILYPYDQYAHHWVIGFLYSRRDVANQPFVFPYGERKRIVSAYGEVEFFVQEKYKIVGERPASGNTTNIGSFPTRSIKELAEGKGPFAKLGKEICDEYWRNFDRNAKKRKYSSVREFLKWRRRKIEV